MNGGVPMGLIVATPLNSTRTPGSMRLARPVSMAPQSLLMGSSVNGTFAELTVEKSTVAASDEVALILSSSATVTPSIAKNFVILGSPCCRQKKCSRNELLIMYNIMIKNQVFGALVASGTIERHATTRPALRSLPYRQAAPRGTQAATDSYR